MPDVTFTLKTFGLDPTRDLRANVVFTPSVQGAIGPDGILVRREVVSFADIHPVSGLGVAKLAQTTLLQPACHLLVSVEWLDGSPEGWAEIGWPVHVPEGGGDLLDLIQIPPSVRSSGIWWVDNKYEPPVSDPTFLWLNDVTGDVYEWES